MESLVFLAEKKTERSKPGPVQMEVPNVITLNAYVYHTKNAYLELGINTGVLKTTQKAIILRCCIVWFICTQLQTFSVMQK